MRTEDWKRFLTLPQLKNGGKKPPPILIWGIVAAVFFLAIGSFGGGEKKEKKTEQRWEAETLIKQNEGYVAEMEEKLSAVLEEIENVGSVKVFLSTESAGSRVLATDIKTESKEKQENSAEEKQAEREETVIFTDDNSGQNPYIVEEKFPQPTGVLVVADGAKNESVRTEIYEAVKALFGLPAHRIKVTY